jgi:hypothetical protein
MKAAILLVGVALLATTSAQAACDAKERGTEACPTVIVPAETAVPGPMGGTVLSNTGTPLFGGSVPPNGFMAQLNGSNIGQPACWINDNPNGLAGPNDTPFGTSTGFVFGGTIGNYPTSAPNAMLFVTPPGYKPLGPLTLNCSSPTYVEVGAW